MDRYEDARSTNRELASLFAERFDVKNLKPYTYGDITLDDRAEEVPVAVRNHTGSLRCSPQGAFQILEICANLVPEDEDPYLSERFTLVSQTLLHAFQDEAGASRTSIDSMMQEAQSELKASLVRGDAFPQGFSNELPITESLYARFYTVPEMTGFAEGQVCFLAEFYQE